MANTLSNIYGSGNMAFQQPVIKTEAQKIAEENAKRAKIGFPPLSVNPNKTPFYPTPTGAPIQSPTTQGSTTQYPNLYSPDQTLANIRAKLDSLLAQVAKEGVTGPSGQTIIPATTPVTPTPTPTPAPAPIPTPTPTPTPTPETPKTEEQVRDERKAKLELTAFTPPTKTYDEIYKQAYEQSGLENIKTSITAKDAEISRAKENLINAEGQITENPWLTETGRVGRIKTLYEMAEPQIARLVNERAILQSQFDTGKASAENVATRTQAEQLTGKKLQQDELAYLNEIKKGNVPIEPKVWGTSETGYYIWEYNDATDKFEKKQVVAPVASTTTKTEKYTNQDIKNALDQQLKTNNAFGADQKVSWETYLWMRQNWINNGGTDAEFKVVYPIGQYLDEANQAEYANKFGE